MSFFGNLFITLGQLARLTISVLELLIILQVVLSWLGARLPLNQLSRLFYAATEALYRPVRALIPTRFGNLDIAPLIVLAGLFLLDSWLVGSLIHWGYHLAG